MSDDAPTRTSHGGRGSMVPPAEVRTYYNRPVLKEPVWTWEIPNYFFLGGLSGAAAVLAAVAEAADRPALARTARRTAALAVLPAPVLLIADLGRPARFHHMLRVMKPTSPMNVGSWVLAGFAPAAVGAALLDTLGWWPRLRRLATVAATGLAPAMSTYTAVIFADTAVPVWHEARRWLPAVFASGSTASAGAAVLLAGPADAVDAARRLMVGGAIAEVATDRVMHAALGELAEPYEHGRPGILSRTATALSVAGAGLGLLGRRRRGLAKLGALASLGGSLALRWAVFTAGPVSAADPKYTVGPQRERAERVQGEHADAGAR